MQKYSAIIVDDESQNIKILTQLLEIYCKQIEVVATAQNINEAELLIMQHNPKIVLLDIEMPLGNGFDLLARFKKVQFEVIFVTAYNQYALQAIKFCAIDYILKPVNPVELKNAVDKAIEKIDQHNIDKRVETLLVNAQTENIAKRKICIHTLDAIVFEEIDNIMYLQSDGNYTHIFLKNYKKETVSKKIQDFENMLPGKIFCRVHNSHIININFIKKYYRGRGGYVTMEDDVNIEVSIRRKEDFLKMLGS